jgi:hypothetical protein
MRFGRHTDKKLRKLRPQVPDDRPRRTNRIGDNRPEMAEESD